MKNIQQYLLQANISSIEFLRDAMAYFDSRIEERNLDKTVEQLLSDYLQVRKECKVDALR